MSRFSQALRAYRLLFFGVFAGLLAAVLGYTASRTPRYTAVTTVMIEARQRDIADEKKVLSELPAESGVIDSEVRVLQSREFAERVVETLDLVHDSEFHKPRDNESAGLALERTVDKVMKSMFVRRSGLTYVIDIAFASRSPIKAAHIANDFAAVYTGEQRGSKARATQQATALLRQRLDEMRGQVEQAEAKVAAYRAANGLLTAEGQSLTEQQLSELNNRYVDARASQADADARLSSMTRELRSDTTGGTVGEALKSDVVRDLRAQRSVASAKVASLQAKLGPRHPDLIAAQRELADIDTALKGELNRILAGVKAQAEIAGSRSAAASAGIASARGTLVGNNAASVRLNELERNAQSVRALYESYLARFRETSTQEGMETADARVIAAAAPPLKPSSPNWPIAVVLGLLAGLIGGCLAVLVRQRLDRGINSAGELEEAFEVPVAGIVPTLESAVDAPTDLTPADYLIERRRSLFSQAFLGIVSTVSGLPRPTAGRLIALTSAIPDEGKSVTSMCLMRSIALAGENVVLVDTDVDRAGLSRLNPGRTAASLGAVLSGRATLDEALIHDERSGGWLLLSAAGDIDVADRLTSSSMTALLRELRERFQVVLLDTAPVLAIANARHLAAMADGVLLLIRWRSTRREDIFAALQILRRAEARLIGAVLTRVDLKKQRAYGYSPLKRYEAYHAG